MVENNKNKPLLKGMNVKPIVEERNNLNGKEGLNVKPLVQARGEPQGSIQTSNNNQKNKD